jgi:hypothetical protein
MSWLGAIFVAIIGVIVILNRRSLAKAHSAVLGGSILPGCVVVEGVVLVLIAVAMFLVQR